MQSKPPIGQILIRERWVEPEALTRAQAEQHLTGMRLCSLLIARGQLDPDNAARALAEHTNVPGVLQKHLEHRERGLAGKLPAAVARAHVALPIGRTRAGQLIVCVRDPDEPTRAAIAAAIAEPVVIAVAPQRQLEQLVAQVYPDAPDADDAVPLEGIDVDLDTRPIALVSEDDLRAYGVLSLAPLDDARVAKDPSQSGPLPRQRR
ncbi:MAG TPA: hypothetical protein VGC42_26135 [Kofleriaceae bacterium]